MEPVMHTARLSQCLRTLLLLITFACAWSQAAALPLHEKPEDESARLFAYDSSVGFDLKEVSAKEQGGVSVRDIDYAAHTAQRGRIKAYLIRPAGQGPFAAVLFFHWLGRPNGNRNQFLDEAVALARQGAVSLLIEGYFPWAVDPVDGKTDRQRVIDETIEVRRALDLLLSQPGVDRRRVGFVGHDYGAMYGANVAGVDKRVKAYILMAPIGSFSYWSLAYWLKKEAEPFKAAYRQALNPVDPITHIRRAAPAALFFQFANSDEHIPKAEALAFYDAAAKPKEVKWYDAKHDLLVEAALKDRRAWLTRQLKLAKQP
jgi:dienelactone hydrolase